jgi:hypothetical protein
MEHIDNQSRMRRYGFFLIAVLVLIIWQASSQGDNAAPATLKERLRHHLGESVSISSPDKFIMFATLKEIKEDYLLVTYTVGPDKMPVLTSYSLSSVQAITEFPMDKRSSTALILR